MKTLLSVVLAVWAMVSPAANKPDSKELALKLQASEDRVLKVIDYVERECKLLAMEVPPTVDQAKKMLAEYRSAPERNRLWSRTTKTAMEAANQLQARLDQAQELLKLAEMDVRYEKQKLQALADAADPEGAAHRRAVAMARNHAWNEAEIERAAQSRRHEREMEEIRGQLSDAQEQARKASQAAARAESERNRAADELNQAKMDADLKKSVEGR